MRIVFVTDVFPKPSETFVVAKFLGLLKLGWDAHVATRESPARNWNGFPQLQATPGVRRRVHVAADPAATVEALRPRIAYFPFGAHAVDRMDLGDRTGCRLAVSFRGFDLNDLDPDDRDYYQDVWARADLLHFVSHDLWRRALAHGCPPDRDRVIVPDAVDPGSFDPGPRVHRAVAGTVERPLRVLSVGRLVWKKGYEHGLQAVRLLVDGGVRCEYRIVGDGDYRRAVAFTIHDAGLDGVARLLGAMAADAVREEMKWADVFLHPAVTEGFGVSVVEAQAMALPVICSDAGGLPENVRDAETGFVAPRRDPHAMAAKLALLAGDPGLRQRMGHAARRRAETHFGLDDQLAEFDRIYRSLADPADPPGSPPSGPSRLERLPLLRRLARPGGGGDGQRGASRRPRG